MVWHAGALGLAPCRRNTLNCHTSFLLNALLCSLAACLPAWLCCACVAPTERFSDREGGYTRIKPEPILRRGDGTEMAIIELV